MLSERSKLCGTGCEVVEELASGLGAEFEKLNDIFLNPLLKLCTRTNRVMVQRATKTLHQIIKSTNPIKIIPRFVDAATSSQSKSLRVIVAAALKMILETCHVHSVTMEIVEDIEKIIRAGLTDAESAVRESSRASYHLYCEMFAERVQE